MLAKPPGGTALDPAHPNYGALTNVWGLLGDGLDSKGTNHLTVSGGAFGADALGDAAYVMTTGAADPLLLTTPINNLGSTAWSILWRSQKTTDANTNGMICGNDDAGNFVWEDAGAGLDVRTGGGDLSPVFAGASFTAIEDFVLTFNPGGSHQVHLFRNGVEVANSPVAGGINTQMAFKTLMAGYSGATLAFEGKLSLFGYCASTELTVTDAARLHTDLYTIFLAASAPGVAVDRPHGSQRPFPFLPGSPAQRM